MRTFTVPRSGGTWMEFCMFTSRSPRPILIRSPPLTSYGPYTGGTLGPPRPPGRPSPPPPRRLQEDEMDRTAKDTTKRILVMARVLLFSWRVESGKLRTARVACADSQRASIFFHSAVVQSVLRAHRVAAADPPSDARVGRLAAHLDRVSRRVQRRARG